MEITTVFQKVRNEFGRPVNNFMTTEPQLLDEFPPEKELTGTYIERNPSVLDVQAIPEMSEHEVRARQLLRPLQCTLNLTRSAGGLTPPQVNTERFTYLNIGTLHQEGGWPKDVDPTEKDQTT